MVVEDDASEEASMSNQTKRYIVVKNHVRELLPKNESLCKMARTNEDKNKTLKRKKEPSRVLLDESNSEYISESDLNELKTVYKKCKAVLMKIESKYGHLLDVENKGCFNKVNKCISEDSESDNYCSCSLNKKIVFDENGQKVEKQCQLENHICPKRIKRTRSDPQPHKSSVQVEYDNISVNLPDTLQDLESILKNPNIDKVYRNTVIDKIYLIRQEYLNDIRFERQSLIAKLKTNPDELLGFKGTNISSLPGYPTKPQN